MTADRTWMEKLGFELEDKGTTTPLWVVVDDCGGERPASLAEVVMWTYMTTPAEHVAPADETITVQEAWIAAGGNPGITATKTGLIAALGMLDRVCDEADAAPVSPASVGWPDFVRRTNDEAERLP